MLYFSVFTIICFLTYSTVCIYANHKFNKVDRKQNVVLVSGWFYRVAIVCGLLFLILALGAEFAEASVGPYIGFMAFTWFTIGMMDRWMNAVILYEREGFQKGWLPWQKKYYKYADITSVKREDEKVKIYFGSKKIALDDTVMTGSEFVFYCASRYREIYGKHIPENKKIPRWDIFNGHVKNAEEILAVHVLLAVFMLGTMGYLLYSGYSSVDEEKTTYIETKILSYQTEESELILSSGEQNFIIFRYEEYGDTTEKIIDILETKPVLGLNVVEYKSDDPLEGYEVYSIKMGDTSLLSFEETRENNIKFHYQLIGWLALICSPLVLMFVGMVVVGRNPKKYSKRIQKMLFKDGYLR